MPAKDRSSIVDVQYMRMREIVHKAGARIGFNSLSAFFHDYTSLRIEFPENDGLVILSASILARVQFC